MAVERFLLGAHHRHAICGCCIYQTFETVLKTFGAGYTLVADTAVLNAGGIIGAPAKFPAEKHIADASGLERGGQGPAIEVRIKAAVRRRAHVGQGVDPMSCEQLQEEVKEMV